MASQQLLLYRRADIALRKILRPPCGAGALLNDSPCALKDAEQGQCRNQHRRSEQKWCGAFEGRFDPQQEIKPDAAVNPGDDQEGEQRPRLRRRDHPIGIKYLRVELFDSEKRAAQPNTGKMGDDKCRDAQPKQELKWLYGLPAKLPALVKRPDPETGVDQRGGVKHDRDREKLP